MKGDLTLLSAVEAAHAIREGVLHAEKLVTQYFKRIEATEPTIRAWACLDPEAALQQARDADRWRKKGRATGILHGVPVGLKDIVDTVDMPTERGTPIFGGRMAKADARMVERLRDAGAVIMGKTKTTELAYLHPTDTTNPHDADRTPAGSSSGSAAAVAARQVPLAVGTQTGGSVIRPASFCGTFGFKPTRGVISRTGVFRTSVSLDQVGVMANTLEDAALLTDALGCFDQADPESFANPRPAMLNGASAEAPVKPSFAWFDLPFLDRLDDDARAGLDEVLDALGDGVERLPVAPQLAGLPEVHKTIYDYEISRYLSPIFAEHEGQLGAETTDAIERGRAISDTQYRDAMGVKTSAEAFFENFFVDYDAILCPSATGEALPLSAGSTGDAIYCTIWTLAGLPCLSLPLLVGHNGLPIGVQLVGAAHQDDRLLRSAAWMQKTLSGQMEEKD
jgi:Asp-tRNA(Asn)/Glu-tRNA(Gln) amidotransferase A subunit family amidase